MSVEALFARLAAFEAEGRFGGRAYPEGMEPFPRTLAGQGFFPGGDGLWREDDFAALRHPSPYAFPVGGIMFLGNDFGTLKGFQKLKLHENPPTWRWLRQRLQHAKVPGQLGFYTNAYLGLRTDRPALAQPMIDSDYASACAAYLAFQIRTQLPRLIVVLGSRPAGLLGHLVGLQTLPTGKAQQGCFEGRSLWVIQVSHPYSDVGKSPTERAVEGALIGTAWKCCSTDSL